uniref:Putative secreted protein n=1 Tax=Ixodes ricinus TaxID=34613 RepID=A0A6B0V867_IXORI
MCFNSATLVFFPLTPVGSFHLAHTSLQVYELSKGGEKGLISIYSSHVHKIWTEVVLEPYLLYWCDCMADAGSRSWGRHALEPLEGLFLERLSVIRVGNVDEGVSALPDALAEERGDAILGDDVVRVRPGGDHAGALLDVGADLADALGGHRGHGQDGLALAVLADGRAPQEVHLAPETRVDSWSNGVGHHLATDVHLNAGVDGRHLGVFADYLRVVDIANVQHHETRVAVHEIEEPLGADAEAAHDPAPLNDLLVVGDTAGLHQVHHAIAEHLGVDAQVLVALQHVQHRIWDAANAHLQGSAVVHQVLGDVLADLDLDVGQLGGLVLGQLRIVLH